jgi:hypothetical protein
MKKTNPNELAVLISSAADCSFSESDVRETVEGVLVRSRIKFVEAGGPKQDGFPWLLVITTCSPDDGLWSVRIDFVGENADGYRYRYGLFGYGASGTYSDNPNYILDTVRQNTERAVTDYLKANFDL